MHRKIRYLTHPQVIIDPDIDIQNWSLNEVGRDRVSALAKSNALLGTQTIVSSSETKAVETAKPLADALGCELSLRGAMYENDRSSTGYLPTNEFETVADQFFAHPDVSIRGWETASAAQSRIVREVEECLRIHDTGDVLFVGHGGVGTLLFCHLADRPINRKYDQGAGGGGCYFEFSSPTGRPINTWQPMENLIATPQGEL